MRQRTLLEPRARRWFRMPLLLPVTQWCIWRCILGMLTDMGAHFRYLPLVVLPPLPQEQFVHVQLLPHLQPVLPSLPMEHNKEDTQLWPYYTIHGINVVTRYKISKPQYVRRPNSAGRIFLFSRWCTLHLRQVFIFCDDQC